MEYKRAEPSDVAAVVANWTDGMLQCRMYGHEWQPSRAVHNRKQRFIYTERECLRCLNPNDPRPTTKHEELSERGTVLADWITYTPGYLMGGVGHIVGDARDELRITTVSRIFKLERSAKHNPRSSHTKHYIEDAQPESDS